MQPFEEDWRRYYPNANPVGWMMRQVGVRHWARFHSLPLSKRYAETDAERQILLARQNTLANEILGADGRCWLVQSFWETPEGYIDATSHLDPLIAWPNCQFQPAFRFLADQVDDEEHAWNAFASLQIWEAGAFDDLLWAVANEDAAPTLWMSCSTGAVYAPYDGGVDLFLPRAELVEELKIKHADWLSTQSNGL